MSTATLIFNPHAGSTDFANSIEQVAEFWQKNGWHVDLVPTQYGGHATEIAKSAVSQNKQLVIAAGGDGTLGEVANALVGTDTILAPIPVGTSNVFARELNMPRPARWQKQVLLKSADCLLRGKVQKMDVGSCTAGDQERAFLLWSGIGADAYVIDKIEPRSPRLKSFGPPAYLAKGLTYAPGFVPMRETAVSVDDDIITGQYVLALVSNTRLYGGGYVRLSPDAKLDDGLMEVWLFEGTCRRDVFRHLFDMSTSRHHQSTRTQMVRASDIRIETTPSMPVHMDGEPAGTSPLHIKVNHAALNILIPNTASEDLFCQKGVGIGG